MKIYSKDKNKKSVFLTDPSNNNNEEEINYDSNFWNNYFNEPTNTLDESPVYLNRLENLVQQLSTDNDLGIEMSAEEMSNLIDPFAPSELYFIHQILKLSH